ncbi:MAG: hypothetical protein HOP11_11815 [Saprospiraceae bacterium]|nr:hypothetical protein [Saprospiraceae bacterium]
MKTNYVNAVLTTLTIVMLNFPLIGQKLPSIVIAGCEAKNTELTNENVADIFIIEFKKLNLFDVYDKHDAQQIATQSQIELYKCFSKPCLTSLGKTLKVDKSVSCQLEKFNDKIYISVRQIDAISGEVDKNFSIEYLSNTLEIQRMCEMTLRKMYGLPIDEQKFLQLTSIQTQESKVNNPGISRLNLSGPRFGFGYISGRDGKSFQRLESEGGYDAFPMISQFGYQFEVAYLNQGNIQGLFEFVPSLSGIEHGIFIPSIAILHGVRSNKSGLEFAVGPLFVGTKRSEGFYNDEKRWIRKEDYKEKLTPEQQNSITNELDRRGEFHIDGGLVIAVGKSIRSGNVNFPINLYVVLKKDSPRIGFSMGFNTKK